MRVTVAKRISVVLLLVGVVASLSAQTIRLGSVAPENSPWGRALNRLAAEWQEISEGRVRVQVFHNGVAGAEDDLIRKMRIGQLQAAALSNIGMTSLSEKILTLSMPLLITSDDEFTYAFDRVKSEIEAEIEDSGFRVMAWSMTGWMRFFSKEEIRLPEQLQQIRMAASPEEMQLVRAYQLMGYQPITITRNERLAALTNGMANAYLTVPLLAAGFQWFALTPYMLDLNIGPAPGAMLISDLAYRRLPSAYRDELIAAAAQLQEDLNREIAELEEEAMDTMTDYGLQIVELNESERQIWDRELRDSYEVTLGTVFDRELYELIQGHLDEFRAGR